MIPSSVFSRYARSLAEVALEGNEEPSVTRDMATYREIFETVPDLLPAFHSPAVPREAKERVLSELIARYPVSQITANFLRLLLEHNRIRYFHEIHDSYTKIVNDRRGIVSAQVTAAGALSEVELSRLRESLARATGRSVTMDVRTDAGLLGGLVVQIGSTVYDGSVRSQLVEMKRRLLGQA